MVTTVQNNNKLILEKVSYRITSKKRNNIIEGKAIIRLYPFDKMGRIR